MPLLISHLLVSACNIIEHIIKTRFALGSLNPHKVSLFVLNPSGPTFYPFASGSNSLAINTTTSKSFSMSNVLGMLFDGL